MQPPQQQQQQQRKIEPAVEPAPAAPTASQGEDPEVARLWQRAARLGGAGRPQGPLVSFHSLFMAMLGGGSLALDPLREAVRELHRPAIPKALAHWRSDPRASSTFPPGITVEMVRSPGPLEAEQPGAVDQTPSAVAIKEAAAELARRTGKALAVRHLVMATLLASGHWADFDGWGLSYRSLLARCWVLLNKDNPDERAIWSEVFRTAFSWGSSANLSSVLRAAEAMAVGPSAAGDLEVRVLVTATLVEGARLGSAKVAHGWLAGRLDRAMISQLTTPPDAPAGRPVRGRAVLDWLDVARRYALTCSKDELNMRHVVAALLSPAGPAEGKRIVRSMKGDAIELARELRELIKIDDMQTWDWLLQNDGPPPELRRPGYTSDAADGVDLLGIDAEAHALSAVLAAAETRAPLSVGLFGDWGSGKSFFMSRMREHIQRLAKQSRESKGKSVFCSEIAQIEFNAWHYMDGDLWSGIVVHLLEQLDQRFSSAEAAQEAQEARQSLSFLDLELARAKAREAAAQQQVEQYDQQLKDPADPRALRKPVLQELGRELREYVESRSDVKGAIASFETAVGAKPGSLVIADVRGALGWPARIGRWWRDLLRSPVKVALVGVFLLVPLILGVTAMALDHLLPKVLSLATLLAAGVAAVVDIAAKARPALEAGRAALEHAQRAAAGALEEVAKPILAKRADAEKERQEAAQEIARLNAQAAELQRRLQAPQRSTFRDFVLERVKSANYRDRQGIVALVHRDFEGLSVRLRDPSTEPKLERIILYIDDLDRCTPDRVVEVLQAIHLMLSFELFIVVVAVDSGWLLQSLRAYYARQFPTSMSNIEWAGRPQFYLEKIFQLPYTLTPLTDTRFSRLVDGLLADSVTLPDEDVPAGAAAPAHDATSADASTPAPAAPPASGPPRAAASSAPLDLQPRNLELTQPELDYMKSLGPIVSSPRAGKRLVNIYRIVRAGLHGDALAWFIDDHFQLTQIFLAAVVGSPDTTAQWFEQILRGDVNSLEKLLGALESRAADDRRFQTLCHHLGQCADAQDWRKVVRTCSEAARYSFETGQLLARLHHCSAAHA